MAKEQNILNLYKKVGETPLERLNRFKLDSPSYNDVSMTYLGRLDPMAEGVLLILAGDSPSALREKILNLPKEYEFECLWGLETDTYDTLGKITKTCQPHRLTSLEGKIEKVAQGCVGKRMQTYPAYSSKTVLGKPLFMWAREGKISQIEVPIREVEIYLMRVINHKTISAHDLLRNIKNKISLVKGDFRQDEILFIWDDVIKKHTDTNFFVTKMKASVSSGTYIRSLVQEMGKTLGYGGTALSIKRTRVGDYLIEDSQK